MRAIEISRPGGPEVLQPVERPMPACGPGEVLVAVAAAGVNRPDVMQRMGLYPAPPGASDLPGLEVAGEIVRLGAGVSEWRVGDRVCALANGGGYAEYASVPAAQCLPVPAGWDLVQAAGLPEACFTVWGNVFQRGCLRPGESLLVHGGTSGIGVTAIQLAVAHGATVYATAGSAAKCNACNELGASAVVNYREQDFVEVLRQATDGRGVDVILDMVGGDYVNRNIRLAAMDGRVVNIAFQQGFEATVNFAPLLVKRLLLTASTLRPQSAAAKAALATALRQQAWPWLEAGRFRPVVHAVFPLDQAAAAHALMESGEHIGKIILAVDA